MVGDEVLSETLGVFCNTPIVRYYETDLSAGDKVAILLHVKLCGGNDLLADWRKGAGQRHHNANLELLLRTDCA